MYIYILYTYIYIYTYLFMCVYIYIDREEYVYRGLGHQIPKGPCTQLLLRV